MDYIECRDGPKDDEGTLGCFSAYPVRLHSSNASPSNYIDNVSSRVSIIGYIMSVAVKMGEMLPG